MDHLDSPPHPPSATGELGRIRAGRDYLGVALLFMHQYYYGLPVMWMLIMPNSIFTRQDKFAKSAMLFNKLYVSIRKCTFKKICRQNVNEDQQEICFTKTQLGN